MKAISHAIQKLIVKIMQRIYLPNSISLWAQKAWLLNIILSSSIALELHGNKTRLLLAKWRNSLAICMLARLCNSKAWKSGLVLVNFRHLGSFNTSFIISHISYLLLIVVLYLIYHSSSTSLISYLIKQELRKRAKTRTRIEE